MRARRAIAAAIPAVACLAAAGLAGCQKPLFPKDEPRSQYDMHERMSGVFVPLEVPDVFGNPQPALRERLSGN